MISQSNNEFFRKKFADLKELVIKENRLIQSDLNKIFKPINETSIQTQADSNEKENVTKLEINLKGIEKMFQSGQYEEIINQFQHVLVHRNQPIKSDYLNYLTKSLVKLVTSNA